MNKTSRRRIIGTLLVALVTLSTARLSVRATSSAPTQPPPQSMRGGPPVVLRAGQGEHPFRVVPPSDLSQLRIQNATITINYIAPGTQNALGDTCLAWPTGSQAAFNYAASIWGSLLNSSVPIKINACWASLEPDVLGHSAPESHHRNFSGAPVANTWYSAALANALSGTDQNDADGLDDDGFNGDVDAEMEIAYNDQGIPWYFGTDGNPSMGQYDFVSVVLHEVCHGLGFAGSMWVYGGQGSWGMEGQPTIYDRFMENGSAQSLLNTSLFPNPSSALAAQLQSNNLYFDGANARAANGGARPKMYAPSTWQPGSSYAHLDEIFNGTANALMTYSLDDGEAVHDPGQVTMGILKDVGWNPMQPAPDLSIVTRVVGGLSLEPGDPITFTLTIANSGDKVASHVAVTDTVPSQVLSPSFASTLAITRTGVLTYVWNVAPLGVGASGVITIYGQLNPGLESDFSLVNTAILWDPEDRTPDNNTSSVLVGGRRVHFPLVMKRWPPIPDTPTLNAISNSDGDGNYTVSWGSSSLATSYTLQEANNTSFTGAATAYSGPNTSTSITGKVAGTYYYRVKASSAEAESGWSNVQSANVQQAGWVTILSENFEGVFPGSTWTVRDDDPGSGRYYWGKRNCKNNGGSYSAWNAGAGDSTISCGSNYRSDMYSWMIHGPFSLAGATAAELTFDWWSKTEYQYDVFFWGASTNGVDFYGMMASGDWSSWRTGERLDLSAVPTLGNLLGRNQVWIAFAFGSDSSFTDQGSFVDDVLLRKRTGGSVSGGQSLPPFPQVLRPDQTMEFAELRLDQAGTWYLSEKNH